MCIFRHTHIAVVAAVVCQAAGGSIWRPMTPSRLHGDALHHWHGLAQTARTTGNGGWIVGSP